MVVVQPRWASWSFLSYAGGLTVLGAAGGALSYLNGQYGDAAFAGWALLIFVVLTAIAHGFHRRERPITAGVFAFASVVAFIAFVAALWTWFGWLGHGGRTFNGFHLGNLTLELLALIASVVALRASRFPLLVLLVAGSTYFFATDFVSNGGNWTAWVTLFLGLVFLIVGVSLDGGPSRAYGFWWHVASGLEVGGSLLFFWHHGNWRWALIVLVALVFVWLAQATGRSSWAVLGAAGLLAATTHFAIEWSHRRYFIFGGSGGATRGWVPPLVFAVTGFLLVALGLWAARRASDTSQIRV